MNQNVPLGATLMGLASILFPVKDGLVKALAGDVSGLAASFFYFVIQAVLALALLVALGKINSLIPPRKDVLLLLLRSSLLVASVLLFFTGVQRAPIAESVVLFSLQAIFAILFAGLLLGERLSLRSWVVVTSGLIGAAIILRLDVGTLFNPFLLLPFASAITFGLYVVLTKRLGGEQHPVSLLFYDALVGSALIGSTMILGSLIAGLFTPDTPYSWLAISYLAASGTVGTTSALLIIWSLRFAPASVIAPLGYLEIVSAAIIGVFVFSEPVTLSMALGATIIVTACFLAGRTRPVSSCDM